jgi:hypothetical protein
MIFIFDLFDEMDDDFCGDSIELIGGMIILFLFEFDDGDMAD